VSLYRQELGDVEELRQQRKAPTVATHEFCAEQRVRVALENRRKANGRVVGKPQQARIASCFLVRVIDGDLERLADAPYCPARFRTEAFELAQAEPAPRSLHEIVVQRAQQICAKAIDCGAITLQYALGLGSNGGQTWFPCDDRGSMPRSIYVKT
jgi:hypothetical protein